MSTTKLFITMVAATVTGHFVYDLATNALKEYNEKVSANG